MGTVIHSGHPFRDILATPLAPDAKRSTH